MKYCQSEHQLAGDKGNNLLLISTSMVPTWKLKLTLTTFDHPDSLTKISKTIDLSDTTHDYCSLFGVNDLCSVIVSMGCLHAFFEAV